MRIVFINQYYPPDLAPTGTMLEGLAKTLVRRGHEVTILCSSSAYANANISTGLPANGDIRVLRLKSTSFGRGSMIGRFADYASFLFSLAIKLATVKPKPDLLVSLTTPPFIGVVGKFIAEFRNCAHSHWIMDLYPDVVSSHGILTSDNPIIRYLENLTRYQFFGASSVITIGNFMAQKTRKYTNSIEVKFVPLWYDQNLNSRIVDEVKSLRLCRNWKPEDVVLMYSGNMGLGHRIIDFLKAAELLGTTGPVWAFCGDGARKKEVASYISSKNRCQLVPYVDSSKLSAHLQSADVHLASLERGWEGLMVPCKIQGIFAAGRPVIFVGSRKNEIAKWIEESNGGWIVAPGDINGLLEAVGSSLNNVERNTRGTNARRYAETYFHETFNTRQIADELESGMNKNFISSGQSSGFMK